MESSTVFGIRGLLERALESCRRSHPLRTFSPGGGARRDDAHRRQKLPDVPRRVLGRVDEQADRRQGVFALASKCWRLDATRLVPDHHFLHLRPIRRRKPEQVHAVCKGGRIEAGLMQPGRVSAR